MNSSIKANCTPFEYPQIEQIINKNSHKPTSKISLASKNDSCKRIFKQFYKDKLDSPLNDNQKSKKILSPFFKPYNSSISSKFSLPIIQSKNCSNVSSRNSSTFYAIQLSVNAYYWSPEPTTPKSEISTKKKIIDLSLNTSKDKDNKNEPIKFPSIPTRSVTPTIIIKKKINCLKKKQKEEKIGNHVSLSLEKIKRLPVSKKFINDAKSMLYNPELNSFIPRDACKQSK